jgi:predicted glycogen debranching enzyme
VCGDPAVAAGREWLICTGLGSYGCGCVAGGPSRSYHGLLVAALGAPGDPGTRTLLVADLEERACPVGGGPAQPLDHRAIVAFSLEGSVPTWRWAIADALLEKRVWMRHGAHTTTVDYRLLQASTPVRLELMVLVNARSHHGGSDHPPIALQAVPGGVRITAAVAGVPPFAVRSDRGHTELAEPGDWCCGLALSAERERGLPASTDHLRACRITVELDEAAPSLTVVASTEAEPLLDGERSLTERRAQDSALLEQWRSAWPEIAATAPAWVRQLVLAADQFVVARGEGASLLAGYPWFSDWGRDTMISLAGLTLATGRFAIAARILRTYAGHVSAGMLPNRFPDDGTPLGEHDFNTADATLWFFETLGAYHRASGDTALVAELLPTLKGIIEAHCRGTRHGIHRDPADGLLFAGTPGQQLTWMDAKVNGEVITPRSGKPVEVNVLWFCALRRMAHFAALCGEPSDAYACLADQARQSFQRFWNAASGCCFDLLDGPEGHDAAIRPNQLLAVALSEELLSPAQGKRLLQVCGQRLLTPMGLRSLDPSDPSYRGHYGGDAVARDRAYHQGTVWAWWLGPWAIAHARVHGSPGPALRWLEAIGEHLSAAGVGSISEIFDGDPPHRPQGCIAQAWSVAEVLRAWMELTTEAAR